MKPPIVFFDCDGVLVNDPLWPKLHTAIGLSEELDLQWFNQYYSGEITNEQWVNNLTDFYRKQKLSKKLFNEIIGEPKIEIQAWEIIQYLKDNKILTAIISSGIDKYVERVAKNLGTDYWRANATFHFDRNDLFTNFSYLTDDSTTKVIQVEEICRKLNIKPTATLFVGDSDNDLGAFKLTQHGILYRGKKEDHKILAWKTINNLMEIKDIIKVFYSNKEIPK